MTEDIRDKAFVTHDDVVGLNFVKNSGAYVFRRHYRQGLRSHILEVIPKNEAEREKKGLLIDGIRWYPKARPLKMFRIFRTRLSTLENALNEIQRVKIVERYLAPDYLAKSSEFVVDYIGPEGRQPVLCGLQSYEAGEIVDPWSILGPKAFVAALYANLQESLDGMKISQEQWIITVQQKAREFIKQIKKMISQAGYVPDLAGVGNLVVVPTGEIKLVDINNISKVMFDSQISLDDRGYPVSDKSIEALYLLEEKLAEKSIDRNEKLFKSFLTPKRRMTVKGHEENFYRLHKDGCGYPSLKQ